MTALDQLLAHIHPSKTFDDTSRRANEALATFGLRRNVIEDWGEFQKLMSHLHCHIQSAILRTSREVDLEMDRHLCSEILKKEYGYSSLKSAFQIAQSGTEGGLRKVAKTLANEMAEQYAQREISARVSQFLSELMNDPERYQATVDEYIEKYSEFLPSDLIEGSAARVRSNFQSVLEKHPESVRQLRKVGR